MVYNIACALAFHTPASQGDLLPKRWSLPTPTLNFDLSSLFSPPIPPTMAQPVAKALNGVAQAMKKPTLVSIPKYREPSETDALRTPKTPQDEGIFWFEHDDSKGEPIQVYELKLEPDGGPNKDRMVRGWLTLSAQHHSLTFRIP